MRKFGLAFFLFLGCLSVDVSAGEGACEVDCLGPGASPILVGEMDIGGPAWGFHAFADFTYWYSDVEGLKTVLYKRTTTPLPLLQLEQKARPGFKVGVGFFTPSSGLDVNAQYTWFYNKQDKNQYARTNLVGADLFLHDFQTAGSSLANVFNRLDLTVCKDVFLGEYFAIAPGGGFLGIWGNFWYNKAFSNSVDPGELSSQTLNNHENFWGVGPYFNLKTEFIYPYSFSGNSSRFVFFMQPGLGFTWTALSAYYNRAQVGRAALNYAVVEKYTEMIPLLEGVIGISWEVVNIQKALSNFTFTVAWEIQQYANLNISQDQANVWDWAVQGLTTGVNFRF